jgi:hypothetical protein
MTSRFTILGLLSLSLMGMSVSPPISLGQSLDRDGTSLRDEIDRLVGQAAGTEQWPLASDATFIRRASLDLIGVVPNASEVREFLTNSHPNKDEALIDRLLSDPRHHRRMADWLDLTLLERRPKVHIELADWKTYLQDSFAGKKPLNQLLQEILLADGTDDLPRSAARFYFARNVEPNVLTRDIGRVFFGRDLQCAQCHNHPHIEDYYQSDYYGIFAFVNRSSLFTDKEKKVFVADKAEGNVEFTSVFTGDKGQTGPRIPEGPRLIEPILAPDQQYISAPADGVRPVPVFSRRKWLAEQAANGNSEAFNRNWANRLWAIMFGRGLVHPLDLHHDDNPPTHPELLRLLSQRLAESNFDTQHFLREVALSKTYRRAFFTSLPSAYHASPTDQDLHLKELLQEKTELETSLEATVSLEKEQLTQWRNSRRSLDEAIDGWIANRTELLTHESNQRAWSKDLQGKTEQTNQLRQKKAHFDQAIAELKTASQFLNSGQPLPAQSLLEKKSAALQPEMDKLQPEIEKLQNDLKPLPELIVQAQEKAEELKVLQQQREPIEATAKKAFDEQQHRKNHTEDRIVQLSQAIEFISATQNLTEILEQWTEHETQLAQSLEQYKQTERDLQETRRKLVNEMAALSKLQREHSELEPRVKQKTEQQGRYTSLQKHLSDSLVSLKTAQEVLSDSALTVIQEDLSQQLTHLDEVVRSLDAERMTAVMALKKAAQQLTELTAQINTMTLRTTELETLLQASQKQLDDLNRSTDSILSKRDSAHAKWLGLAERQLVVSSLTPLTPEQLAWSLMEVTGVMENQIQAELNELNKTEPLTAEQEDQTDLVTKRRHQAEKKAREKLLGSVNVFVSLFGHGAGQPQDGFFATVDQSLFFANAGTVQGWIAQGGNSLYQRLLKTEQAESFADELYLSVYCRPPSQDELTLVTDYLNRDGVDRATTARELIWALVTSSEFRFNH